MRARSRLAWKLGTVLAVIMAVAIALSGYINDRICDHYTLESARTFLRFNSESIIQGVGRLMMNHDNEGIEELIVELSRNSKVYGDIRLISHPAGKVVASRFEGDMMTADLEDQVCVVCHESGVLKDTQFTFADSIAEVPGEGRILSVMAPILNEPGCRDADCHAHIESPPVLGFLSADYALQEMDAMVADRRALIAGAVLISLVSAYIAMRVMFVWLLERPIRTLVTGTKHITANDFDFRFDGKRSDEIGVLEDSFDTMTTALQDKQKELRGAKEYLEGIVENSVDMIISVTPDGLIQTFNRGAELTLGYEREEVIGSPVACLFADPREGDSANAQLDNVDSVKNYETRFLTKNGSTRCVLLTLSRLKDPEGNAIGTVGLSKDITQEKELLSELVQSKKLAAIGQAVMGIQHAIKNMLNALTGGAYVVRVGMKKDNKEQMSEGWAMVEEGIERIGELSRSMLRYAKGWTPELQKVELNDLLASLCKLNHQAASDRGVALRFEQCDNQPAVRCDPKLIHMAVTDILANAIDACTEKDYGAGERREVVMWNSTQGCGESVVIGIRDNGCGMNEETKQNIFTPFFSTKIAHGTGLGLATTERIVSAHNGHITVESEPNKRTVVYIDLPVDGPGENNEVSDDDASSHD